jgi:alkylhydroperoxidase family enzyme
MTRVPGIDPSEAPPPLRAVFTAQVASWGKTLEPYRIYARRPGIFLAVRAMWDALDASGLVDGPLKALVCRRVASRNGCPF